MWESCKRGFCHPTLLHIHKRMHTKEKKFSCEVCQKAFVRKTYSTNHCRIHTDEKPFVCELCKKKIFILQKSLKKHIHTRNKGSPNKKKT